MAKRASGVGPGGKEPSRSRDGDGRQGREAAMSAVVEDLLRLGWEANADGRPGMRDALLTMAVAEAGADDAVLADRCRRLLIAHRPDHCFAWSTTVGHALRRPK